MTILIISAIKYKWRCTMIIFIIWLLFIGGIKPIPYPPVGDDPPPKMSEAYGRISEGNKANYISDYTPVVDVMD